jgi:hypothetical protein
MRWPAVALALGKRTHGATGGQLTHPEVIMSRLRGQRIVIDQIVTATDRALREVAIPRFLRTERGFHGRFYSALHQVLAEQGLLQGGHILEMEPQKSIRHGMSQRPDIVLHVPVEESGARVSEHNLAVWALKRHATLGQARNDCTKLDAMFEMLCYPPGIFVNIDAKNHFAASYNGKFPDRLRTVAVWLDGEVVTRWGSPEEVRPVEPNHGMERTR